MDLHEVKKNWVNKSRDRQANLAAWDSMAERYTSEVSQPGWDSDPFLMQIAREVPLSKSMSVLDIGCGPGGYSAALAERVGNVTGIDISPKMLSHAQAVSEKLGIDNLEFICADFCELEMERKFDLVFAHLTPAICDAHSFEKMLSLACNYCYLVKPVHRTDSVADEIKQVVGQINASYQFDKDFLYAFAMLWQSGFLPTINYYPAEWKMEKSTEEARAWYINRLKSHAKISPEAEKKAIAYLKEIAVDEKVYETISSTIATMGWRMAKEENK